MRGGQPDFRYWRLKLIFSWVGRTQVPDHGHLRLQNGL